MNICFVYKHYPIDRNYDSGIGRYLNDLTRGLKNKNKITIVTTSENPRLIKTKNLTIHALPYPKFKMRSISFLLHVFNIAIKLPIIIKDHDIQLIEFANWEAEGFLFSLLPNIILRVPIVVRLHTPSAIDHKFNNRPKYFSEKLKEYCEKIFVNQKENYLTTSTRFNAKECRKVYRLPENKPIEIIPLGIKSRRIRNYEFRIKNKELKILYVGRLEKRKGIDILVKAALKVLAKVRNARFIIVGRENQNEKWVSDLRNTLPYQDLHKVHFLGYINSPKTIDRLYKEADVCVIPSRYESFGLTVLDAMSYGKAVVASNVGGIPEIIENYKNGIVVDLDKTNKFASEIINLCVNPTLRKRIGKNSINTCSSQFSLSLLAKNTLDLYETVATKTNLK